MRTLLALFIPLAFLVCSKAQSTGEDTEGILFLNDNNFDETVRSNSVIFVQFYAPWCGHCRAFAPEYQDAARQFRTSTPAVPFAKVDATTQLRLTEKYGVKGYPTMKLFIDGKDQEYTGGRTGPGIVTWITKKIGPAAVQLDDPAAAEQFERDNRLAVIGFFPPGYSTEIFLTAARKLEDVMFAYSFAPAVQARYQSAGPASMKMFFPHDEKSASFQGDLHSVAAIETFVRAHRTPLVHKFTGDSAAEIFDDTRTILFLFRNEDEQGQEAERQLHVAAAGINRRMQVSTAGSNEPMDQRLMDYIGVEPEELPCVRIVTSPKTGMQKYKQPTHDLSAGALDQFVREFDAGHIRPWLKTEAVPESQPGPIFTLVGSTFNAEVRQSPKDVLVEFYAPWCGHCKKFSPVYKEIARKFEGVQSMLIAKLDATVNDVEGVDTEGFPTLKFWPAHQKDAPLDYDGQKGVDAIISWLEEKASIPFNRNQLRSEL